MVLVGHDEHDVLRLRQRGHPRSGVSTAEFFAELAQAFLFDKDGPGPKAKLAAYYHGTVKAGE